MNYCTQKPLSEALIGEKFQQIRLCIFHDKITRLFVHLLWLVTVSQVRRLICVLKDLRVSPSVDYLPLLYCTCTGVPEGAGQSGWTQAFRAWLPYSSRISWSAHRPGRYKANEYWQIIIPLFPLDLRPQPPFDQLLLFCRIVAARLIHANIGARHKIGDPPPPPLAKKSSF